MADDQVKYSDLISDDVAKGIAMLDEALKGLRDTMASLKDTAVNIGESIKGMGTVTKEQQQVTAKEAAEIEALNKKVKDLTDKIKKLEDVKLHYRKLTDTQIASLKAFQAALQGSSKQVLDAVNAIEIEKKSYNELNAIYNTLKDSLNAMTIAERQNSEAGKAMTAQAAKIYDTMNELQKATGKYTLQVGKYRAAFDGLGYSFQQILREAPSALNLNQFFLAISNNIPMFLDQLKAFKNEQAEIKSNLATMTKGTAEYAEQLGKVESVGKKLGKVLISWQSLVLVGLMILRNWDRIVSGITSLFSNLTKEQKMLKAVNEEAASSVGELTAKFVALQNEWKNLKAEDKSSWLEQHKNDWNELGISIDNANDAENLYVKNTSIIQKAIDDRARSIAAMKLATEKYEEAFKKQVDAEQKMANAKGVLGKTSYGKDLMNMLESGDGSGYFRTANLLSGDPAFMKAIGGFGKPYNEFKSALVDYYDARKALNGEIKELNDEARNLITTFVLPGQGDGPKKGPKKEPKDQVADLLTLTRQLEDQIIANIENEYKRLDEEETKRHERFIEDRQAELKLLPANDPRRAVINQQIEEEERTHERNMEAIDQKRYDELAKLTQKRLEDEKKSEEAARKAAEEAFKQEEKEFKQRQEIDKRLFQLTKHTATEEKKFVMQQQMEFLQWRIDHAAALGISPEMLEVMKKEYAQMMEMFNKGIYSTGGKNVKGNYSSISELLWPDLDKDQTSALNSVFDQAKEALNSWMDARKAAADQAKELADDEVSAAENALNREIELRNQGYANDVALREKELADAKAAQKKALEMQQKAKEEELAINTALEASNMAVAIANLFKQFGYWAIPMAAVMLGAWGSAKYSAFSQIKSTKYREGGVMLLEGGSHESGHDVNLGIGPDGSNLRAEGGEYFAVINKRSSRKYGSQIPAVVNALNSGMFEDRYIKTSDAVGLLPQVIRADNGTAVDLSSLEGGVDALVKQGESRWSTEGEWRVMRYKNLTRRVRIS